MKAMTVGVVAVVCALGLHFVPSSCVGGSPRASACGQHVYWARGSIQAIDVPQRTLHVAHEAIHGFGDAATSTFEFGDTKRLASFQAGDVVVFEFEVVSANRRVVSRLDRVALASAQRTAPRP